MRARDQDVEVGRFNVGNFEWVTSRFLFKLDGAGRRRLWQKLMKMMGNDVQMLQAIDEIRDRRIEDGGRSSAETVALGAWGKSLRNGLRLSSAIEGWASSEEIMLISAGENSGRLQQAMASTIRLMEAKRAIVGAVMAGLAYPLVLVIMAFAVTYLFGFKIVPAFASVARGDGWTGLARALINIAWFAQHWLWVMIAATIALIIVFFISLPRLDGPLRVTLDRYPPFNVYRILQGSTWLIALSSLVGAGMRIETAIEKLGRNGSDWLANRLEAALTEMRAGIDLGAALRKTGYGFPDREIIEDLAVYANLSGFEHSLNSLATEWLEESVRRIRDQMRAVFGICILFVASYIAFMVMGMMQMQLQMSNMLQQTLR